MELEILETIPISPSPSLSSPPLLLSHLDTDRNLQITFRTLRLYSSPDLNNFPKLDPFQVISPEAISSALSFFFPLAGKLHCRSDSRLEIHCSYDDSVPLIRAELKVPLSHLASCPPDSPFLDCLAPDLVQTNHPDARVPLLSLQITKFSCGGFALGMCVRHTLCDGSGANQFLTCIAHLIHGKTKPAIQPVWDRPELLGPRNLPRVNVPLDQILMFDADVAKNGVYGLTGEPHKVKEWFHVSELGVERLRDRLCKEAGFGFTTFEALSAFIWRARIKASKENKEEAVKMVYSMNISKIINPPLPAGYWGNICVPVYITLSAKNLINQPLWKTATLIKESKRCVNDEYVRSYIDFQELHYKKGINTGSRVFAFTDWRRLGHSKVDFGFGGPVSIMPLSWKLLGSLDPCFFLPSSVLDAGKENDEFRVLVCLDERDLGLFEEEMTIFAK